MPLELGSNRTVAVRPFLSGIYREKQTCWAHLPKRESVRWVTDRQAFKSGSGHGRGRCGGRWEGHGAEGTRRSLSAPSPAVVSCVFQGLIKAGAHPGAGATWPPIPALQFRERHALSTFLQFGFLIYKMQDVTWLSQRAMSVRRLMYAKRLCIWYSGHVRFP